MFQVASLSTVDRPQQTPLLLKLATGHLRGALASTRDPQQTSGPGFGVLVPAFALARVWLSVGRAHVAASMVALVPLAVATVAATRASGIGRRSALELLALLATVAGVPILACYVEAFHPVDVLATAAVLAAYAAMARGRVGWASVLLGFGLATRQWAIVAVAVAAVLATGRDRRVVLGGTLATFAVIVAPFALTDPWRLLEALSASQTTRGGGFVVGLLPLTREGVYLVSRYVPLAVVGLFCWWLHERAARATPRTLLAALTVVLSIRAPLDPAGFAYYAAPGYAFLVVLVAGSWASVVAVAEAGILLQLRLASRRTRLHLRAEDHHWPAVLASTGATALLVAPVVVGVIAVRRSLAPTERSAAP